jgi:hypothetical protein
MKLDQFMRSVEQSGDKNSANTTNDALTNAEDQMSIVVKNLGQFESDMGDFVQRIVTSGTAGQGVSASTARLLSAALATSQEGSSLTDSDANKLRSGLDAHKHTLKITAPATGMDRASSSSESVTVYENLKIVPVATTSVKLDRNVDKTKEKSTETLDSQLRNAGPIAPPGN